MKRTAKAFIKSYLKSGLGGLLAVSVLGIFLDSGPAAALVSAYLLSLVFVGSIVVVLNKIDARNDKRFFRIFLITLALRFTLVLAAIVLVLEVTKIHQIYFTVSFIISYIFHSINEIIFINKTLETDTAK